MDFIAVLANYPIKKTPCILVDSFDSCTPGEAAFYITIIDIIIILSVLNVNGIKESSTTGNFDVKVEGELVHSKRNGDQFVDSDEKWNKIIEAVKKHSN